MKPKSKLLKAKKRKIKRGHQFFKHYYSIKESDKRFKLEDERLTYEYNLKRSLISEEEKMQDDKEFESLLLLVNFYN